MLRSLQRLGHLLLSLKFLGTLLLVNVTLTCPLSCCCHNLTGLVQCHALEPPEEIPSWVRNLSLSGSNFSLLQGSLFRWFGLHLTNLTTLLLSNNQIGAIESKAYADLPILSTLDLSHNQIQAIESKAFLDLPNLSTLDISHNQIGDIESGTFADLPNLSTLDLSHNHIWDIQSGAFADLPNLSTLDLSHNRILDIQSGAIAELPILSTLDLSHNQIRSIESGALVDLPNLSTLDLSHNQIRSIESGLFVDLPNLSTLDLSHNPLGSFFNDTFLGLSQLQTLKLNDVLGKKLLLSPGTLRNLRTLELTDNDLQTFPRSLLELPNLQNLYLGHNSIRSLDKDTVLELKERKLRAHLSPNPISCDCQNIDLLLWLKNSSGAQGPQCFSPPALNGTPLLSLDTDSLGCLREDLETASYVFFGIVLALIGVIFLMVLYLNRQGIKRWLNNFREACRDQMEGYHYRYEQDSDPRRANADTGI